MTMDLSHLSWGSAFVLVLLAWALWSLIGHGAKRSSGHRSHRPPGTH